MPAPLPVLVFITTVLMSVASAAMAQRLPLQEAANQAVAGAKRGIIVTAESAGSNASVRYSLSGSGAPANVSPEDVVFEIGSVSKVFTGLLLAQAVVEGRVSLDATVGEVFSGTDSKKYTDPRVSRITLRQLATHTSGLPRLPVDLALGADPRNPYAHYDRHRMLVTLTIQQLGPESNFPQSYSNFGMGLLGEILATVYGKPWEDLVREKITLPLGMRDTSVVLSDDQKRRMAPGYSGSAGTSLWDFGSLAGAGALRSTAADLVKLAEAFLRPESTPFPESLAMVMRPHTPDGSIGLALLRTKVDGNLVFGHDGATAGYCTGWQFEPSTGVIRVILTNNATLTGAGVLAIARGEKPRTNESGRKVPPEKLQEYVGIYPLDAQSQFTVVRQGEELWTQLTGQEFLRLFPHETEDRFFLKEVAAEIQFEREHSKVHSLVLTQNGVQSRAAKSDKPVPPRLFATAAELAPFEGEYDLLPGVSFTVEVRRRTLYVRLTGQEFYPVFQRERDSFEYDVVPAVIEFERNESGAVTALRLYQNGAIQRAAKREAN